MALTHSIVNGRINASWINEEDDVDSNDEVEENPGFWEDYYEGVMDDNDQEHQQDVCIQDDLEGVCCE